MLVESYEVGLRICKNCSITCITPESEVVNAGGFYSKLGKPSSIDDRLESYYNYQQKQTIIDKATQRITESSRVRDELMTTGLTLSKEKIEYDGRV